MNKSLLVKIFTAVALFAIAFYSVPSRCAAAAQELEDVRHKITRKRAKWRAEENSISRLPDSERRKRLGANKKVPLPESSMLTVSPLARSEYVPPRVDYRNLGYVSSVKDQGGCGSCWAFAMTAGLESHELMKKSKETDLSEQTLVSCSGAGSCSGGGFDGSANFLISTGLPSEACFPYTATNNQCSNACEDWQQNTAKITNWLSVTQWVPTVDDLKLALVNYGPLVSMMEVYSDFFYYKSGVYSNVSGTFSGTHAVEIVGYNDDGQYFVAKNSWGTDWGEKGFFKISYSQVSNSVLFGMFSVALNLTIDASCQYLVYPEELSIYSESKDVGISVSAKDGCVWNSISNDSWIRLSSGSSGEGTGLVEYTIDKNDTGKERTGTVNIAGKKISIIQSADKETCPATIDEKMNMFIPYMIYMAAPPREYTLWANLAYEERADVPGAVYFKIINYGGEPFVSRACEAATLTEKMEMYLPKIVSYDGKTELWGKMKHDPSIPDGVYFRVMEYGQYDTTNTNKHLR